MRYKTKDIETWVMALRSGEYKQTKRTLQNARGFCCLGVACKIFIPEKKQTLEDNKYLYGASPMSQRESPKWLVKINSKFAKKVDDISLMGLNDVMDLNFDEIADILEAVFILKVLG